MLPPRGHFPPRGPLASVRQWPSKLPGDQNIHLSGVQNSVEVVQTLGKNWLERRLLGINLIEMQFRDLLCVEPVHHGRGLAGLGNLRSQFMETEAFQVRQKWSWCSCVLMGRSINKKKYGWKIFRKGEKIMLPIMLKLTSNNQKLLSLKWNLYLSRKNWT